MEQKERFRFAPRYTRVAAYHTPWPRLCLPPVGLWQCVLILLGLLSKDCSELSGIQETGMCFFLSGPLYVIGRINNFEGLGRIFTDLHPSSPRLQGQQVFNGRILCSHHGPRSSLRLSQRHECLKEAQAPNATESKIRTTTSCKNGTCVLSFPAQPTKLGSGLVCQGLLQVVNCKSLRAGMLRKVPLAFCASPTLACWPFVHLRGFEMPPRLLPRLADTDNGSISQISQSSILSSSGLSTKRPSSQ